MQKNFGKWFLYIAMFLAFCVFYLVGVDVGSADSSCRAEIEIRANDRISDKAISLYGTDSEWLTQSLEVSADLTLKIPDITVPGTGCSSESVVVSGISKTVTLTLPMTMYYTVGENDKLEVHKVVISPVGVEVSYDGKTLAVERK